LKYNSGKIRWQDGSNRRRGYCVAKLHETQNGPTLEQEESEAREDERTGAEGYKLKENTATQPVHLEMETVDDVVRPKRIAFNYGFQAKFLRTGPSVPGNVIRLAFENFGREWRVSLQSRHPHLLLHLRWHSIISWNDILLSDNPTLGISTKP